MSGYLKHKSDLFLGVAELNRQQEFLGVKGFQEYILKNSATFGVIHDSKDKLFKNFKVVEDVYGSGKLKIEERSYAIDSEGKMITQDTLEGVSVPNDGSWYWVKISHQYLHEEVGTVSIDKYGNLMGTGTKFLEVLRGQPDFPSKVKLTGTSQNTLDYEVVEVVSDTSVLLAGTQFIPESNLKYSVVGTFTPGHVVTNSDRFPFQYNGCRVELVQETTLNTPPLKTEGREFYIARVRSVGGNLTIHDKRDEIYTTLSEYRNNSIVHTSSPLIGIEWVKFQEKSTARDHNLVQVGFGMRTSAWTLDSPERAITFSTGVVDAGRYKSTSQFSDGELDGWRIYYTDGSFSTIHTSEKQGTSIKCVVDSVNPSKLATGDILVVTPPVDRVEVRFTSDNGDKPILNSVSVFEAKDGYGILQVPVPESTYKYVVEYRYIQGSSTTRWELIPSDTVNGYYDEGSFNQDGSIIAVPNKKTYTSSLVTGFIELVRPSNSYTDIITLVTTGDRYGIGEFELDNGNPHKVLRVNTDYMVQKCTGVYTGTPMNTNHIIGLRVDGAISGNSFTLMFVKGIQNGGHTLQITSGYVDQNSIGTTIYKLEEEDFDYPHLKDRAVIIKCIFTGSQWETFIIERDRSRLGDIKMISNINLTDFQNGKGIIGKKYQGWALCDGANGTLDLSGKFVVGYSQGSNPTPQDAATLTDSPQYENFGSVGNVGGSHAKLLEQQQTPLVSHTHTNNISVQSGGSHSHDHTLSVGGGGSHVHKGRRSAMVSTGNGVKVPLTDVPDDGSGGRYDINTTQSNGNGTHTHTLSGGVTSVGSQHTHTLTGGVQGAVRTGPLILLKPVDSKPRYIVVGFIQRVKQ